MDEAVRQTGDGAEELMVTAATQLASAAELARMKGIAFRIDRPEVIVAGLLGVLLILWVSSRSIASTAFGRGPSVATSPRQIS